jgi:hypothetical protein
VTDEDGYLVQDDQDEDEMEDDYLEPIEDNPYKDVKVEGNKRRSSHTLLTL